MSSSINQCQFQGFALLLEGVEDVAYRRCNITVETYEIKYPILLYKTPENKKGIFRFIIYSVTFKFYLYLFLTSKAFFA